MLMPFEWVVGDSSKDHTVTAPTSSTTCPVTERYTTMRDSTRALGAILASAAGDALGAPYEFKRAVVPPTPITRITAVDRKPSTSSNVSCVAPPMVTLLC